MVREPVACVVINGSGCHLYFRWQVGVPVYEAICLFFMEKGGNVFYDFLVSDFREFFLGIAVAAFAGACTGECESPAGRKCSVQCYVYSGSENLFNQQIPLVGGIQPVSMPNHTPFPVDNERLLASENLYSQIFGKIIFHPHVVVSGKVVDLDSLLPKLS